MSQRNVFAIQPFLEYRVSLLVVSLAFRAQATRVSYKPVSYKKTCIPGYSRLFQVISGYSRLFRVLLHPIIYGFYAMF